MSAPVALFGSADLLSPACVTSWLAQQPEQRYLDYEASAAFLMEYASNPETFTAYRREVERFLHWLWEKDGATLNTMDRQTIHRYVDFCKKPPANWMAEKSAARFTLDAGALVFNTQWRPFIKSGRKGVAFASQTNKAMLSILSSYFNYLIMDGAATINPVLMMRQKNRHVTQESEPAPVRRLSRAQWQTLLTTIENDIKHSPRKAHRALFLFSAFYLMGLRISELADSHHGAKTMGHFVSDHHGNWWFHVTGKGNKSRRIPVNDDMQAALKTYRAARNLTPLPPPGDESPLIENFSDPQKGLTTRMIRYIVTHYFNQAAKLLRDSASPDEAEKLESATAHWLRHTSLSEQVAVRDKRHVQQDAGHSDSKTTEHYISTFDEDRHESMQALRIREYRETD